MHHYIITGVSSGLGEALTQYLLQNPNNRVTGIGRKQKLQHPSFQFKQIDLSDPHFEISEDWFTYSNDTESITLINNAGVIEPIGFLGTLSTAQLASLFQVNVVATHRIINDFVARAASFSGIKRVINISSGAGRYPVKGWSAYCASKAALDMLSLCLAEEQPDFRVYSLAPGIVNTPMQGLIRSKKSEDFPEVERFQKYFEEGELLSPDFVAKKMIDLLLSEQAPKDVLINLRNH